MSWEKVKLGCITKNLDSLRKPLNEQERNKISSKQLYPYIGANNIMGYVDEFLYDEPILCIAEDGGSWGKDEKCCSYYNEKCWVNNHAHVLGFNGKANLKYLLYYLNYEDLNKFITGTTRGKLTKSALEEIQIPLPPLSIQQKIAAILDKADALRRKDQALLKKYDDLAQAIFMDMFGDPVRNEKGWPVKRLGDYIDYIGDIGSNGSNEVVAKNLNMSDSEDYALMVRTTNLASNDFTKNVKYVSKETYDFFKKSKIYGGEIIMNKIGSAGDFWIMPNLERPVSLGLNQLVIRLKDLNTLYLFYYLSTDYGRHLIKSSLNGAVTKSITKSAVKDLPLIYPDLELQLKFEKNISIIKYLKEKTTFTHSETLFQSLLQRAFRGELVN